MGAIRIGEGPISRNVVFPHCLYIIAARAFEGIRRKDQSFLSLLPLAALLCRQELIKLASICGRPAPRWRMGRRRAFDRATQKLV